jgi:uncharacterized membrane protein
MKKSGLVLFIVLYLIYVVYYYFTRDNFFEKFIQITIIFGIVATGIFIYQNFFGKRSTNN